MNDGAVKGLVNQMLRHAGLTQVEAARRMGVSTNALAQYCQGMRRPGLMIVLRIAEVCGARLLVEFSPSPLRPLVGRE